MNKLRYLATVIIVAAVLAVGVVPLAAEAAPFPSLYFCTVYECDTDPGATAVGAGYTVTAYIAATTGGSVRGTGITDGSGVAVVEMWPTDPELAASHAVTFKVNGLTATTDPAVVATLAPSFTRLDFCEADPDPDPCTWVFPHGLDVDPLAVFPRYYDCATVTLGSLNPLTEIPAELQILWHYKEALTPEWQYFIPGSGGTLISLVADNVYLMVVESACTWDIPQS